MHKISVFEEQYTKTYKIELIFSNSRMVFYYNPIYIVKSVTEIFDIEIEDSSDSYFELDYLIKNNYMSLLYAHRNDYVVNFDCIRLDNCKIDKMHSKIVLKTSRAKCFDHLATNFAMDYKMEKGMTLRSIYEYSSLLVPLENSKMANVLGINALVFLSDGTLLMPLRGNGATISKHMVTSSIAQGCFVKDKEFTLDDINYNYIYEGLKDRLFISEYKLKQDIFKVYF